MDLTLASDLNGYNQQQVFLSIAALNTHFWGIKDPPSIPWLALDVNLLILFYWHKRWLHKKIQSSNLTQGKNHSRWINTWQFLESFCVSFIPGALAASFFSFYSFYRQLLEQLNVASKSNKELSKQVSDARECVSQIKYKLNHAKWYDLTYPRPKHHREDILKIENLLKGTSLEKHGSFRNVDPETLPSAPGGHTFEKPVCPETPTSVPDRLYARYLNAWKSRDDVMKKMAFVHVGFAVFDLYCIFCPRYQLPADNQPQQDNDNANMDDSDELHETFHFV